MKRIPFALLLAGACAMPPLRSFEPPPLPPRPVEAGRPDVEPIDEGWYPVDADSVALLAGERMVEAFTAAGVPADLFQAVFLDHATTEQLIASGTFGFVNFTGSVAGGRAIERAAAGTFTGVGLELTAEGARRLVMMLLDSLDSVAGLKDAEK